MLTVIEEADSEQLSDIEHGQIQYDLAHTFEGWRLRITIVACTPYTRAWNREKVPGCAAS
jgi:hypothetical protein